VCVVCANAQGVNNGRSTTIPEIKGL